MKGSRHGDNTLYMNSLVSDGSTIYRFDKNPHPAAAVAQILRYDAAQRDVVAVTKPTRSVLPGWASLATPKARRFNKMAQQGISTGSSRERLRPLLPSHFQTAAETSNVANGSFIARKDGAILSPPSMNRAEIMWSIMCCAAWILRPKNRPRSQHLQLKAPRSQHLQLKAPAAGTSN